ncbi:aminoglycoside 6-adenylyltransferase [Kribbella sp. NPDC048928]|uniref:aminoglycoside 6-adenylyltransferase n=1 Tax=Kribbella sp. NPDC048928 TaxID=3364111 RepID=UPI003711640C
MPGPEQRQIIENVHRVLADDKDVDALLLTGSIGRDADDECSDVDFLLVAGEGRLDEVAQRWTANRGSAAPLVYDRAFDFGASRLFNQITNDWVRYDVVATTEASIGQRSQSTVKVLFDRTGVYERLPERLPLTEPSPATVRRLVPEFFRVLSMLPIVLGRSDFAVGASGSTLLRQMLIDAFQELVAVEDRGGAMYLRRLLPDDHYTVVAQVPSIEATEESVLAVHQYCAQHFTPVARSLCERTGVEWPTAFVAKVAERTEPIIGPWLTN